MSKVKDWDFLFKEFVVKLKTPMQIAKDNNIEDPADIGFWLEKYEFPPLEKLKQLDKETRIKLVKSMQRDKTFQKKAMRNRQTQKTAEMRAIRLKNLADDGNAIALIQEELRQVKLELNQRKMIEGKIKFTETQEEPVFEELDEDIVKIDTLVDEADKEDEGGMLLL